MKKLLFVGLVGTAGYLFRRLRRPDPARVSADRPERTVEKMERAAGEPVRP